LTKIVPAKKYWHEKGRKGEWGMPPKPAGGCALCTQNIKRVQSSLECRFSCGAKVHQACWEEGGGIGNSGDPSPATYTCETCSRPNNQGDPTLGGGVLALLKESIERNLLLATELGEAKAKIHFLGSENAELKQTIQHFNTNQAIPSPGYTMPSSVAIPNTAQHPPIPDRATPPPAATANNYAAVVASNQRAPNRASAADEVGTAVVGIAPGEWRDVLTRKTKAPRPNIITCDIYVAPKDSSSNDAAVVLVKSHLSKIPDIMDHIEQVHSLKMPNKAVIKCKDADSRKIVKDTLEKAIGDSHQIEHSRKPRREIKIHDVVFDESFPPMLPDGTADKDAILLDILAKNKLPDDCIISVKKVETVGEPGKPNSFGKIYLLVDEKTKLVLLNGDGIKVGWSRCRQLEEISSLLQCYKCRGFNHTRATCWLNKETPEKNICVICSEDHRPKDCPFRTQPENFKCNNCVNHNKKQVNLSEPNNWETNHRADNQNVCLSREHARLNHEARLARD
jgi:hypothetical protein